MNDDLLTLLCFSNNLQGKLSNDEKETIRRLLKNLLDEYPDWASDIPRTTMEDVVGVYNSFMRQHAEKNRENVIIFNVLVKILKNLCEE